MSLLWAVVLIGVLVAVHELGHYAAARLFGVRVLRVSLGFGPRVVAFARRGTEYAISAVPLGGYVKMLGEDAGDEVAPADEARSFAHKPLWQRVVIVLAGPAANLIFPAIIYFHFYVGEQTTLSSTVGAVFEGQPADGVLQPGDRIVAIDDAAVRSWEDVTRIVGASAGRDLRVTFMRGGERPGDDKPITKIITPRAHVRRDLLGARETVGLIGVAPHYLLAQIGVEREDSPAAKAGLRTFDVITSVQGRPVASWHDLDLQLRRCRGEALLVTYLRPVAGGGLDFAPVERLAPGTAQVYPDRVVESGRARYETGIRSGDLFVHDVEAGSPAAEAGLRPGDELTALDGQPLSHWELLEQAFEEGPERTFRIGWRTPSGEAREASVRLQPRTRRDEYETESTLYLFGAEPAQAQRAVAQVPIEGRVGGAMERALERTGERVALLVRILALMATGRVPVTAIHGPIMLFHLAGVAASHGADEFSEVTALISINLGLLNLLPVPILDGGQLALLLVEAVRRRPLRASTRRRAGLVGLALLAALMLLAAHNDLVGFWRAS